MVILVSTQMVWAHDHPAEAVDLETGPPIPVIATDELRAAIEAKLPLVVVDARGPEVFAQGHLPGAVNLPVDQVENLGVLIPKSRVVVVYCGGPQCPHSLIVGRWLVNHGWPLVRHYEQGYPAWTQAGYPVEAQ